MARTLFDMVSPLAGTTVAPDAGVGRSTPACMGRAPRVLPGPDLRVLPKFFAFSETCSLTGMCGVIRRTGRSSFRYVVAGANAVLRVGKVLGPPRRGWGRPYISQSLEPVPEVGRHLPGCRRCRPSLRDQVEPSSHGLRHTSPLRMDVPRLKRVAIEVVELRTRRLDQFVTALTQRSAAGSSQIWRDTGIPRKPRGQGCRHGLASDRRG